MSGDDQRCQRLRFLLLIVPSGLLEGLGAVTSSRDESYDKDNARFKRLEDEIHALNGAVCAVIASERRAIDDRLGLLQTLETLGASDLKNGVLSHSADTVAHLDGLKALHVVAGATAQAVERPALELLTSHILEPLGRLLRGLPALRRLIDARRDSCSDYDSYVRRLRAEQLAQASASRAAGPAADAAADDAVAKAETKVALAAAALAEASAAAAAALDAAERSRAALARNAALAVLSAGVHSHACCADAMRPLLAHFPGAASGLAELAGCGRVWTSEVPPVDAPADATSGAAAVRKPADGKWR